MTDFEKKCYIFLDKMDNYINNVILADNLSKKVIIFGRIIPWMILTTILGILLQPVVFFVADYIIWVLFEM